MSKAFYERGQLVTLKRSTMGKRKMLSGFDYRLQKEVERSSREWREELVKLVKTGGRRRHEHGETFGHERNSLIAFEIYGNVQVQK